MNEIGYVKIDRKILNWRWYKNIKTFKLFIHLILTANFTDGEFEKYTIKRGQVVTGLNKLSLNTGLSVQEIRTALNHLKSTNDITIRTTSKYSIITILNYDSYENLTSSLTNNQQTFNKRATNNQQQYNKNKKNNKNKNDNIERKASYSIEDFERKSLFTD